MDCPEKEADKVGATDKPLRIIVFGDDWCDKGQFINTLLKNAIYETEEQKSAMIKTYLVPVNIKTNTEEERLCALFVTNATNYKMSNNLWGKLISFMTDVVILLRTKMNKEFNVEEEIMNINPKWNKKWSVQIVLTEEDQPTTVIESIHMPIVKEDKIYEIIQNIIRKVCNDDNIILTPGQVPEDIKSEAVMYKQTMEDINP